MDAKLYIYKASAGSGKTHILTREYLTLAFEYSEKFSQILAVTFTNKAAEEMKMRILRDLQNIRDKGELSVHYSHLHQCFPNMTTDAMKRRAGEILDNILHNYTRFSVSTIDSFIQRVVRAFSFELNVQSGYRIELDHGRVISELTDMMYRRLDSEGALLDWLVKYALYRVEEGKNWDVRTEIRELASEIFKERFQGFSRNIAKDGKDAARERFRELFNFLRETKYSFENRMKQIAARVTGILQSHALNPNDCGQNFSRICKYLTESIVEATNPEDFKLTITVEKASQSAENWYNKNTKTDLKSAIESAYPALNACLREVITLISQKYNEYVTAVNTIRHFYAFGILSDLSDLLPEYRDEKNLLLISDTTQFLKEIIGGNDAPFVYEKVGNQYKHILIDEFQDTSGFQWENFRPLLANSLADAASNLIVGDVKQSIYRWRGGDWNLLLNKVTGDIGEDYVDEIPLDTNWRSAPNIVHFNNSLFVKAPELLQHQYNLDIEEIIGHELKEIVTEHRFNKMIMNAYSDSQQHAAHADKLFKGMVQVSFIETEGRSNKAFTDVVDEQLPALVEKLITEQGYKAGDICILVRRNDEGSNVVQQLLGYMNSKPDAVRYPIISADSLQIKNSDATNLLLCAIKWLIYNDDEIQRANLMYAYSRLLRRTPDDWHQIFAGKIEHKPENLPDAFVQQRAELQQLSLYELVENLVEIFGLNKHVGETAYVQAFLERTLDFCRNNAPDRARFVDWWEQASEKESLRVSETQDALNVMTIHKSKGLSFTVVIMPYCNWEINHSAAKAPVIWCKTEQHPYDNFDYLPIRYKKELADSLYVADYFEEKLYACMDALNMLYVAFTRPVDQLIVMAPTPSEKTRDSGKISSVADLLYHSLKRNVTADDTYESVDLANFFDDKNNVFVLGEQRLHDDSQPKHPQNDFTIPTFQSASWRNRLSIQQHSVNFFAQSIEYIGERINYGSLMHQILASIYTVADTDRVLQQMYAAGRIDADQMLDLRQKVLYITSKSKIKQWFREGIRVKNESALLTRDGHLRIPDRIVIEGKSAIVIDFKFGEPHPDYHAQVNEYKQLLTDVGYSPVQGYLYYAETDTLQAV